MLRQQALSQEIVPALVRLSVMPFPYVLIQKQQSVPSHLQLKKKSSETDIIGTTVHHLSSTVLQRWHNTQYDMFMYYRRGAELPVMFTMRSRYGSYYR